MEQKKPESEAEMRERIRKEYEGERPESIRPDPKDMPSQNDNFNIGGKKGKGSGSEFNIFSLKPMAAILIISLIVSFLAVNFIGVTSTNYNSRIGLINGTLSTLQSSVKTAQDSTASSNAQLATVANQIKTLQDNLAGINAQLGQYAKSGDVSSLKSNITDVQNNLTQIQRDVASLKSSVGSISDVSGSLATDEATIKALQTQLATDEATIKTLNTNVAALQANQTGTSSGTASGSGVTSTLNGVTATITGTSNWLTGSSTTSGMALSATQPSGTFGVTIVNTTGSAVTNFQLGLGFYVYDNYNGGYTTLSTTPTGSTLTDNTLTNVWTLNTATGYSYVFGFQNGVAGSNFLGLGGWTIPTGTSYYTMTFTLEIAGLPLTNSQFTGHTYYITPIKAVIIGL